MRARRGFGMCIVVALLCGACGQGSEGPNGAESMVGLWRDTCPRANVKVLDLRSDGSYIFYADPLGEPRSEMSRGEYTITDDTLTFEEDTVCGSVAGTYSWVREGEEVTFTLVDDACGGRVLAFDEYVYAPADFPLLTESIAERGAAVERVARAYEAAVAAGDLDGLDAILGEEMSFSAPGQDLGSKEAFLTELVADPGVGRGEARVHVGVDQAVVAYEAWGFGGATLDEPAVQVDLLTVDGARITRIESRYGADGTTQSGAEVPVELIDAYRVAWSSGNADDVQNLYSEDAVRSESLYFVLYEGIDAIADFAAKWFDRHPESAFTVVEPFVFGDGADDAPTVGALFTLTDASGCELPVAVVLDADSTGAVTNDRVFYDLHAIQDCGWRR